mgnify:CR=1 FL=1
MPRPKKPSADLAKRREIYPHFPSKALISLS